MRLDGSVVLVTGSSRGIGKATARALAKKGARVVVTYMKDRKEGQAVLEEVSRKTDALLVHLDVRSENSIGKALQRIEERFGGLDVLINNAGVLSWKDLREQSQKEIDEQVDTNLKGMIKMTKAALPLLERSKKGVIVNIASGAGKTAYAGMAVYCATKFGVRGFSQALAGELGDIKVFCVNPGTTATRMTDYQGTDPAKVADVIIRAIEGKIRVGPERDVDVWEQIR